MKEKLFKGWLNDLRTAEQLDAARELLTARQIQLAEKRLAELNAAAPTENEPAADLAALVNETAKTIQPADFLAGLTAAKREYDSLSVHEKMINAADDVEIVELVKKEGIYSLFELKRSRVNDAGYHFLAFNEQDAIIKDIETKKPILDEKTGRHYAAGDSYLRRLWKKTFFRNYIEKNATGELITVAAYGGMAITFIRPAAGKTIELERGGVKTTITPDNWDTVPVGIWSNIGRGTKISKCLSFNLGLMTDYSRKASDKFYKTSDAGKIINKDAHTKYFIHLEKRGDGIYLITKNGNALPIPKNLDTADGFGPFIEWAQNAAAN